MSRGTVNTIIVRLIAANSFTVITNFLTILAIGYFTSDATLGVFFLVLTFCGTVSLVSALSFDAAVPAARPDDDAGMLFKLACFFSVVIGVLSTVIFVILDRMGFLNIGTSGPLITALVLVLSLSMAFAQTLRLTAIRFGNTRAIEGATLARGVAYLAGRGVVVAALWVGAGWGRHAGLVFVAVECLAYAGAALATFARIAPALRGLLHAAHPAARTGAVLRAYAKFPLVEWPSNIVDSVTVALPLFLVNNQFGLVAAGVFGLTMRILATPARQVIVSVAEAYQARYSELVRTGRQSEVADLFWISSRRMTALCLGSLAVLVLFVLVVVPRLPEGRLHSYAEIIIPLAVWIGAGAVVNINSRLVSLLVIQEQKLIYDFTALGLLAVSFGLAYWLDLDLTAAMYMIATGQTFAYVVYFMILHRATQLRAARP